MYDHISMWIILKDLCCIIFQFGMLASWYTCTYSMNLSTLIQSERWLKWALWLMGLLYILHHTCIIIFFKTVVHIYLYSIFFNPTSLYSIKYSTINTCLIYFNNKLITFQMCKPDLFQITKYYISSQIIVRKTQYCLLNINNYPCLFQESLLIFH
jgi:hypothetical protein